MHACVFEVLKDCPVKNCPVHQADVRSTVAVLGDKANQYLQIALHLEAQSDLVSVRWYMFVGEILLMGFCW